MSMVSKTFFPIGLAVLSIMLFVAMIVKHEHHLKNSQSMFISLAPVDPRSLLQGDYMTLNYELFFSPDDETFDDKQLSEDSHVQAWVVLDEQRKVIKTVLSQQDLVNGEIAFPLILNNRTHYRSGLYPATKSFMFAEGLGDCYQKATYAEFKVDNQGKLLLANLVGDDLQSLNCENQAKSSLKLAE